MKKSLVRAIYIFGSNGLACLRRSYVTNIRGYRCDHVELLRFTAIFAMENREFKVTTGVGKNCEDKKFGKRQMSVKEDYAFSWKWKINFINSHFCLIFWTQNIFSLKISLREEGKFIRSCKNCILEMKKEFL